MLLETILADYPLLSVNGHLPEFVNGFSSDSRKIKPGDIFICIEGREKDGHQFIQEAIKRGAVLIVCEKSSCNDTPSIQVDDTRHFISFFADRYYGQPSKKLKVTGITGTNGKTTTAHYLYEIYQAARSKSALMGTIGVKKNGYYTDQTLTTPCPEDLHKTLWTLQQEDYEHVAMEVSSHALVQKRVEHCVFHAAVFTNLTHEHLDYHQTMDHYFEAKAHLFTLLDPMSCIAVINSDDPYAEKLQKKVSCRLTTFGIKNPADIKADQVYPLTDGRYYVKVSSLWSDFVFLLHLHGRFNLYNALGAAATALADDIPVEDVISGLEALRGVPGRLERVPAPAEFSVYVDYAHTPDGLTNVLQTLKGFPHRRIILVFGCRGNRDRTKRPVMGRIAEQFADEIILTSDNPADEDPAAIAQEIMSRMQKKPTFIPDRREAVHYALSRAKDDDIVVITGKGREDYQLVGDHLLPYSDHRSVSSYYLQPYLR